MPLNFSGKYNVSPDVISEEYMGETMLLNTRTLVYIRLDGLAGSLWRLLEGNDEIDAVFEQFQRAQDMPRERLESFVNGCIAGFRRAGLIALEP